MAKSARPRPLALALPLLLMALGGLQTPPPWGVLWLAVPALGAAGFLANLHPWRLGWMAPAASAGWMLGAGVIDQLWAWLLVAAVATASLVGLVHARKHGAGRSVWAVAPLLALAAIFPLSSAYRPTIETAVTAARASGDEAYASYQKWGVEGAALTGLAEQVENATRVLIWFAEHLLPGLLFLWGVVLAAIAVLLARRTRRALGRPLPRATPFPHFRVPEQWVWVLLIGLALVALRQPQWTPLGVNLAFCAGLGYCLQGLAVVDFALLIRGLHPGLIWVLFLFVSFFAMPVMLITSTALGLADVWLDLRGRMVRVEPDESRA